MYPDTFLKLHLVKFIYSEKATKIWHTFHSLFEITYIVASNYMWKMGQVFVPFSEYLNFTIPQIFIMIPWDIFSALKRNPKIEM